MSTEKATVTEPFFCDPYEPLSPHFLPGGGQPGGELLGEIETAILSPVACADTAETRGTVSLVRDRGKRRDPHAISVEDIQGRRIGYLASSVTVWLGPLIDRGVVRVEGCLRRRACAPGESVARHGNVILTVFLRPAGRRSFCDALDHAQGDLSHEMICRAFAESQQNPDPERVFRAIARLQRLPQEELAPEARLFVALLPGIAREAQAARGICAVAILRSLLAGVIIGAPRYRSPWTFFPLSWPSPQQSPYVLLAEALQQGEAAVEELATEGEPPHLRVINRLQVPILIPEGDTLVAAGQSRMLAFSVLVAAEAALTLPAHSDERERGNCQSRPFPPACDMPPTQGRAPWGEVELPGDTTGMLVAKGDRMIGVDLFDSASTFAAIRGRQAESYWRGARCRDATESPSSPTIIEPFLKSVVAHARPQAGSLGHGDALKIAGDGIVGSGLLYAGRLCHLAAFSQSARATSSEK